MPLWYRVSETLDLTNSRSILIWSPNVDEDTNNNLNLILDARIVHSIRGVEIKHAVHRHAYVIVRNDMEGKEHGAVNVQWTLSLRGPHKVLQLAIVMEPHRDRKGIRQVISGTRQRIVRLKGSSNVSEMSKVLMNHSALIVNCE